MAPRLLLVVKAFRDLVITSRSQGPTCSGVSAPRGMERRVAWPRAAGTWLRSSPRPPFSQAPRTSPPRKHSCRSWSWLFPAIPPPPHAVGFFPVPRKRPCLLGSRFNGTSHRERSARASCSKWF